LHSKSRNLTFFVSREEKNSLKERELGELKSIWKKVKHITMTQIKSVSTLQECKSSTLNSSNDIKWNQTYLNHHFTQNKNKNKNKINNVYNNTNFRGGIDQSQNSEEIPIYDKDNDSNTLSFLL